MIGLKPTLGLLCAFLSASVTTLAAPVPIFQEDSATHVHLSERSSSFNTRQKWQRDEINCIQILNPAAGANYHPGWFVRMNYGTSQCQGVTAAGPWTIHLYNNPEIQQGGKIRFDYHEVIVDGLDEYKTQYVWNIPADQTAKARNVRKSNDYYVRVETYSREGIKLVGNVGPFAITADGALSGLKRREDQPASQSEQSPSDANPHAEFALRPKPVVDQTQDVAQDGTPLPVKDQSSLATGPETPGASQDPAAAPKALKDLAVAPKTPVTPMAGPVPASDVAAPAVSEKNDTTVALDPHNSPAPLTSNTDVVSEPRVPLPHNSPPDNSTTDTNSEPDAPLPHNLPPDVPDSDPASVVTPISHGSLIPTMLLFGGLILAGVVGLGYLGGVGLGQVGAVLGAIVGGVVGGVAALVSLTGIPV